MAGVTHFPFSVCRFFFLSQWGKILLAPSYSFFDWFLLNSHFTASVHVWQQRQEETSHTHCYITWHRYDSIIQSDCWQSMITSQIPPLHLCVHMQCCISGSGTLCVSPLSPLSWHSWRFPHPSNHSLNAVYAVLETKTTFGNRLPVFPLQSEWYSKEYLWLWKSKKQ